MRITKAALFLILCLLPAAGARAGTLTMASWVTDLDFGPVVPKGQFSPLLGAAGTSTATSISVNLAVPQYTTELFLSKTSMAVLNVHVAITLGGAQVITATPSMAAATAGVPGTAVVMTAFLPFMGTMVSPGAITLLKVPLSVGVTGQATSPSLFVLGYTHQVTVDFYAWTPGTRTFSGLTSMAVPLPDAVLMGSFGLSAAGGGTVTLVAPLKVTVVGGVADRKVISYTTLKLNFVPEPSALLLLGAAASLALVARRRAD